MQNANVLTVSQVNNYITAVFKAEELLHDIALSGEVYNFGLKGGYAYFSLKDDNATIPCVCFSIQGNHVPRDGESVLLVGSVTYYAKTGKISFVVRKISAFGQGALNARFEALKQKLLKEGIFDESHKKPIPLFPMNVAVITSKSGAVIHDIVTTVRKNNPKTDISVFDVRVQGEDAPSDIVKAIKFADDMNFDMIIVARGGGAFEDLLPFYDEGIARAVYNAKTPIVSAVGHEVDVTFCDFAADLRVPTPTAAGEVASFNLVDTLQKVKASTSYVQASVENLIYESTGKLKNRLNQICFEASEFFARQRERVFAQSQRISNCADRIFNSKERGLEAFVNRISVENPLNVLKKGAMFVYKGEKRIKNGELSDVQVGDELLLKGNDVDLDVVVKNINCR